MPRHRFRALAVMGALGAVTLSACPRPGEEDLAPLTPPLSRGEREAAAHGLDAEDLDALAIQAVDEAWSFTVGRNGATDYALQDLCGFFDPAYAPFDPEVHAAGWTETDEKAFPLPAQFDWRTQGAVPPVRDQRGCGGSWAYASLALLESAVRIVDGVDIDLSEQWLLSDNVDGWGCGLGSWAQGYYSLSNPILDVLGRHGAPLESDYPKAHLHPHAFVVDGWHFVDGGHPSADSIKRAILEHGPVQTAVRVDSAFQAYIGGVFDADAPGEVNHAVVLVGWDDNLGDQGAWILRNSWGTDWGEGGYMYIAYGCCDIGYGANYVAYSGQSAALLAEPRPVLSVSPARQEVSPFWGSAAYEVSNLGLGAMPWTATVTSGNWLQISSGLSGQDSGSIHVAFEANTDRNPRTGTIRVAAPQATGSPITVTLEQAGAAGLAVLSVAPLHLDLPKGAGQGSIDVANVGVPEMHWSASVLSGDWLRIASGRSGTRNGAVRVAYQANTSSDARTGLVQIDAPGAVGSPIIVTLHQAAEPFLPALHVTPLRRRVPAAAGATVFSVLNSSSGTMPWAASVQGGDWLRITSAPEGKDSGTITVSLEENTNTASRIGLLRISAPSAVADPVTVSVVQAGVGVPHGPGTVILPAMSRWNWSGSSLALS